MQKASVNPKFLTAFCLVVKKNLYKPQKKFAMKNYCLALLRAPYFSVLVKTH